jgi:hypothetical protein
LDIDAFPDFVVPRGFIVKRGHDRSRATAAIHGPLHAASQARFLARNPEAQRQRPSQRDAHLVGTCASRLKVVVLHLIVVASACEFHNLRKECRRCNASGP